MKALIRKISPDGRVDHKSGYRTRRNRLGQEKSGFSRSFEAGKSRDVEGWEVHPGVSVSGGAEVHMHENDRAASAGRKPRGQEVEDVLHGHAGGAVEIRGG